MPFALARSYVACGLLFVGVSFGVTAHSAEPTIKRVGRDSCEKQPFAQIPPGPEPGTQPHRARTGVKRSESRARWLRTVDAFLCESA